ncbi:MAG: hypothetical protein ACI9EZ_000944 [Halobacteriales archaeon]|jgi:hypothetical protein
MDIKNSNRAESERDAVPPNRALFVGTVAGIFHGIIALYLWNWFGFESFRGMFSAEPLFLLYTLSGMFALGFIPGLLYAKWESISPGLLIGGLLSLSTYGTWATIDDGSTPVDPTPFGWYILLWVGVAILISGAGWAEMRRNQ